MRMNAGHESVIDGSIVLDGRDISHLPPARRGTAMMFQNYALFPYLSALDHVAFSLKMKGVDTAMPADVYFGRDKAILRQRPSRDIAAQYHGRQWKGSNAIHSKRDACITASTPHDQINKMSQTLNQFEPALVPKSLTTDSADQIHKYSIAELRGQSCG